MLKKKMMDYLICGIVFTRGADGATISEIRSDLYALTESECHRLHRQTDEIVDYLNQLPGLVMETLPSGAYVWLADSFHMEYVAMNAANGNRKCSGNDGIGTGSSEPEVNVAVVRPAQMINPSPQISNISYSIDKPINDSSTSVLKIPHGEPMHSVTHQGHPSFRDQSIPFIEITDDPSDESTLNAVPIPIQGLSIHCDVNVDRLKAFSEMHYQSTEGMSYIGDDILLSFLTKECDFSHEITYPARCGHCVSGQTIAMALDELKNHPKSFRAQNYLVNLGTMDILIGRDIYEIEADYHKLIETLLKMNKIPICTTLPPIVVAEDEHEQAVWPQLYQKLLLFNRFLEDLLSKTPIPFIDFWSFFIADDGKPVKPYYQSQLTTTVVAGTQVVKFALLNKIGRGALKKNLTLHLES